MSRLAHCVIAFLLLSLSAQAATYYECLVLVGTNGGYASLVDPGKATDPWVGYYRAYRADLPSGPWNGDFVTNSVTTNVLAWFPFPTNTYPKLGAATQANFAADAALSSDAIVSGAGWSAAGSGGHMGFDNTDDYLLITNAPPPPTNGFTIAAWIKVLDPPTTATKGISVYGAADLAAGTRADQLGVATGMQYQFTIFDAQSDYITAKTTAATPQPTNEYVFLVATWSGGSTTSSLSMYTNAQATALAYSSSGTFNGISVTNKSCYLGRIGSGATAYFGGLIADLMRISNVVTSAQMTNLFNDSCTEYGKTKL